jgi:hypothetical protein
MMVGTLKAGDHNTDNADSQLRPGQINGDSLSDAGISEALH